MSEEFIAIGGAFVLGLLIGWILSRGGGAKQAPSASAPTPVAASGGSDERRAASAEMASMRRRLASVEAALREVRRGA